MRRWRSYEAALADLTELEPDERIGVLLEEWTAETLSLPYDDVRQLFVFAWGAGPASTEHDRQVMTMLRWIAPVRDSDARLYGTLTVFRPMDGAERPIRWTLDPPEGRPANGTVRAEVEARDVLAHLSAANQVLLSPDDLKNAELV
jgi:hypothetical protein